MIKLILISLFFLIIILIIIVVVYFIIKNTKRNLSRTHLPRTHLPRTHLPSTNLPSKPRFPAYVLIQEDQNIPDPKNYKKYEAGNFPENNKIKKSKIGQITGLALSGGGVRASSSSLGILQVLNQNSLLDQDYINYVSCNSGSTWTVLPAFYQVGNSSTSINDILGTYNTNIDFLNNTYQPMELGNVLSNNQFDIDFTPDWWMKSVGNSFFKPYGLFGNSNENTNIVTSFDSLSADSITKGFNTYYSSSSYLRGNLPISYSASYLRSNLPIPISLQSCIVQYSIDKDNKVVKITDKNYLPFDSSPISSGFLYNPALPKPELSDTDGKTLNDMNLSNFTGRIDSYAFNYDFENHDSPAGIKYNQYQNIWDPVMMSGISSMASGAQLAPNEYVFNLQQMFNVDFENSNSNNRNIMVDGYLVDDLGIISLLARGVERIVAVWNPHFEQIFTKDPVSVNDFVYIIDSSDYNNINYQFQVGVVKSIDSSTTLGNKYNIDLINVNYFSSKSTYIKIINNGNNSNNFFRKIIIPIISTIFNNRYIQLDPNTVSQPTTSNISDFRKNILQDLKKDNQPGDVSTINNLIVNYALTGIMYYNDTFLTCDNCYINVVAGKKVDILFYVLSPSPLFYNSLSDNNKSTIDNIKNFPNICTLFPYRTDFNEINTSSNCQKECQINCLDQDKKNEFLVDLVVNDVNLQKITATQVYAISNLTGFMCNKIIIPYLKNEQISLDFQNFSRPKPIDYNSDYFTNKLNQNFISSAMAFKETLQKFLDNINKKFNLLPNEISVNTSLTIGEIDYDISKFFPNLFSNSKSTTHKIFINRIYNFTGLNVSLNMDTIDDKKIITCEKTENSSVNYLNVPIILKTDKNITIDYNIETYNEKNEKTNSTPSTETIPINSLDLILKIEVRKNEVDQKLEINISNFKISIESVNITYVIYNIIYLYLKTSFQVSPTDTSLSMIGNSIGIYSILNYIPNIPYLGKRYFSTKIIFIIISYIIMIVLTVLKNSAFTTITGILSIFTVAFINLFNFSNFKFAELLNNISTSIAVLLRTFSIDTIISSLFYKILFPIFFLLFLSSVIDNLISNFLPSIPKNISDEDNFYKTPFYFEDTIFTKNDNCTTLNPVKIPNDNKEVIILLQNEFPTTLQQKARNLVSINNDKPSNIFCGLDSNDASIFWILNNIVNKTEIKYQIDKNTIKNKTKILVNTTNINDKISYQIDDSGNYIIIISWKGAELPTGDKADSNNIFVLDTESNIYYNIVNPTLYFRAVNCGNLCLSYKNDDNNCGSCGNKCQGCEKCCGNICVDVNGNNNNNCGSCGNICPDNTYCCDGRCLKNRGPNCKCASGWSGDNCDQKL